MSEVRLPAPVPATIVAEAYIRDPTSNVPPGAIALDVLDDGNQGRALWHRCPCGSCNLRVRLPLRPLGVNGWAWDGNREKPTLSPSIFHHTGGGPHWHGFLRAGVWVQA